MFFQRFGQALILMWHSTALPIKIFLLIVFPFLCSQLYAQPTVAPVSNPAIVRDTAYRREIFRLQEVEPMKQFFLKNASLPAKPTGVNWNRNYRHECINAVRAALDILLFGNSGIPDSLFSQRPLFNNFETNDVQHLAARLVDSGYLTPPDTLLFAARNRGEWVPIIRSNERQRSLRPMELRGSLWYTLLGAIGKVEGYSVFVISLCDGHHAAVLTVDHRNPDQLVTYWSDQTPRHPYRYFKEHQLQEISHKFGWEAMLPSGPDTLQKGVARGLDEYVLYAVNKYWCDCGLENERSDECCQGKCFPMVQVWRVRKKQKYLYEPIPARKALIVAHGQ